MSLPVICFIFMVITLDSVQGEPLLGPFCVNPSTFDGVAYDPDRQVCCEGTVHDARSTTGQNCCGNHLFDSLSHMCCGREAIPIYDKRQCCGGRVVYNPETQMCCGNNVYRKSEDFNTCCGNYPINARRDTCCHVVGSSGMTSMPSKGKGQCCGLDFTFDPEIQMCCLSQTENTTVSEVVSKGEDVACCGGRSYNTLHQICCAGIVYNRTSGRTECCGRTTYNPDNEHCCAGALFPIGHGKCCGDRAYHPSSASCCLGVVQHGLPEVAGLQRCCGPRSYLDTESICCSGELHRKTHHGLECCGKDAFSSNTHLCCAGNIRQKAASSDACCGGLSYNPSTETCCTSTDHETGGQTFPLAGGRCCYTRHGGIVAYDPSKATCCAGNGNEVFYPDVPANASVCCGQYLLRQDTHLCDAMSGHPVRKTSLADDRVCSNRNWRRSQTFNSITQICHRGRVRSRNRVNNLSGCGPYTLDPDSEICCMGRIHPNRDRHGNPRFCCHYSTHSYVPQRQTCCSGRVDNIPEQTSKCCRNKAYDTATHTCDRNGMVRQTSEMVLFPLLCGSKPFHPSEHECCGEVLIGRGQTCCRGHVYETGDSPLGEGQCCNGIRGYNPYRDICCGGVVHENIKQGTLCCGFDSWDPHESHEICCEGRLQSSSGGFRRSCSGGTAYNALTETVCNGVVHPRPNSTCCGTFVYDDSTEICCGGNVYSKETSHTRCCGAVAYNPSDRQLRCCDGSLHSDASDSRCCGNQLFSPSSQHCCFDMKQNATYILSAAGYRNCHSLHLDGSAMHVYCRGRTHAASPNGECCGDAYIPDNQTQMCCHGNIVSRQFGQNSMCCNDTVVDSTVTEC